MAIANSLTQNLLLHQKIVFFILQLEILGNLSCPGPPHQLGFARVAGNLQIRHPEKQ